MFRFLVFAAFVIILLGCITSEKPPKWPDDYVNRPAPETFNPPNWPENYIDCIKIQAVGAEPNVIYYVTHPAVLKPYDEWVTTDETSAQYVRRWRVVTPEHAIETNEYPTLENVCEE